MDIFLSNESNQKSDPQLTCMRPLQHVQHMHMSTTSPNERRSREQVDAFAFAARASRIAECYNKAD